MKRKIVFSTLVFLIITYTGQAQWEELTPALKKMPVRIISGKKLTYYTPVKKLPLTYDISGYDKLYLYSRTQVDDKSGKYAILYYTDHKPHREQVEKIRIDRKAVYTDKSVKSLVSKSHKTIIDNTKHYKELTIEQTGKRRVDFYLSGEKNGKRYKLKPINDNKIVTIIKGNKNRYYNLASKIPTRIHLKQSGKLIVYTRKRMTGREPEAYSFEWKSKSGKIKNIHIKNAKISRVSAYTSRKIKAVPSIYHKTVIDINQASEILEFSSRDAVDARFIFKPDKKKQKWIPITVHSKTVPLKVRKKELIRKYYRLTQGKPIEFDIRTKKPVHLRILVRGEFTYDMFSANDFVLEFYESGKLVKTYKLTGERSQELIYLNEKERVPGTLDKIFMEVPSGEHHYEIKLKDKDKSALIRIAYRI